jgi:hypothetical protein
MVSGTVMMGVACTAMEARDGADCSAAASSPVDSGKRRLLAMSGGSSGYVGRLVKTLQWEERMECCRSDRYDTPPTRHGATQQLHRVT